MEQITMMPRIGDNAPDFEAITTIGKLTFLNITKVTGWYYFLTLQILLRYVLQK